MTEVLDPGDSISAGTFRPCARSRRLVVQALDEETLVYDLENHHAHRLSAFAGRLWGACDGHRTVDELCLFGNFRKAEVVHGLRELGLAGLLEVPPGEQPNRRRMLGRLGRGAAVPAVVSILVPAAAAAQSCIANGGACGPTSTCCSGCCKRNGPNPNTCRPVGPPGQCY